MEGVPIHKQKILALNELNKQPPRRINFYLYTMNLFEESDSYKALLEKAEAAQKKMEVKPMEACSLDDDECFSCGS
jgi:hypothetical protein